MIVYEGGGVDPQPRPTGASQRAMLQLKLYITKLVSIVLGGKQTTDFAKPSSSNYQYLKIGAFLAQGSQDEDQESTGFGLARHGILYTNRWAVEGFHGPSRSIWQGNLAAMWLAAGWCTSLASAGLMVH